SICGPVRWGPHPVAVRRRRPTSRNPRRITRNPAWRADMTHGAPAAGIRAAALLAAVALLAPQQIYAQSAGLGAAGELVDPNILRVCADPSNMPFTDKSGEGFQDKLVELVAAGTGRSSVSYSWFPSITGFL